MDNLTSIRTRSVIVVKVELIEIIRSAQLVKDLVEQEATMPHTDWELVRLGIPVNIVTVVKMKVVDQDFKIRNRIIKNLRKFIKLCSRRY